MFLSLSGCNKEDNPVPVTPIEVLIYNIESNPKYSNLQTAGNAVIIYKPSECLGYKCNGVVLYRYKTEGAVDDFKAFDVTCTHEASTCAMEVDTVFSDLMTCPCCGSIFNLMGGYMEKGPAKFPLRQFNCDFYNGDVRIY